MPTEASELRVAANSLSMDAMLDKLRPAAWGSIFWGAIAILSGLGGLADNPINALLAAIGFFLVIEGIWLLRIRRIRGLLVDGFALAAVGLWNVVTSVLFYDDASALFVFLGLIQLVWAGQSFRRYATLSALSALTATPETWQGAGEILSAFSKSNPEADPRMVSFLQKSSAGQQRWFIWLGEAEALFYRTGQVDVFVVPRGQLALQPGAGLMGGSARRAVFSAGGRQLRGEITELALGKFSAWSGVTYAPCTIQVRDDSRLAFTIVLIILALVVFGCLIAGIVSLL